MHSLSMPVTAEGLSWSSRTYSCLDAISRSLCQASHEIEQEADSAMMLRQRCSFPRPEGNAQSLLQESLAARIFWAW